MGINISKKKKIIPLNNKYIVKESQIFEFNNKKYISSEQYLKLVKINKELEEKINRLEKSTFECIVCYNKDSSFKKKIRCNHDLCINCYYLIQDKKCPLCRVKIKKF